MRPMSDNKNAEHDLVIFIDQEKFKLETRDYTPRELIRLAEEDPADTTLVLKQGNDLEKFTELDKPFRPKNGSHFVIFTGA